MNKYRYLLVVLCVTLTLACALVNSLQGQDTPPPSVERTVLSPEAVTPVILEPSESQSTQEMIPTLEPSPALNPTPGSPAIKIVAIHANSNISLAIDDQGQVWQWGGYKVGPANSPCKGGDACLLLPTRVPNLSDVVAVSAGFDHRMALRQDGTVWGWGKNEVYQLGQGYGDQEFHAEALPVPGLTDVVAVSAGGNFTLALKQDGTVWAWGMDSAGQLGNGKNSYTPDYPLRQESPGPVINLTGVVAIDTGWHHGIVLRSDGTVWTWGFNQLGELGLGGADTDQHPVPAQVPGLTAVTTIAGGFTNSIAQKADGSVWVWGGNLGGQLDPTRLGTTQAFPNPVPIAAFSDAVQVDACSTQMVALKADGTVWILGFGEIGSPMAFQPGQTPLKNIVAISCAEDHLLALDQAGVVWAWGNNNVGQLGNGTMQAAASPQPVSFP